MMRYETLMLVRTSATSDELSALQNHIETLVSQSSGKFISYDIWGKYKLAYPVKKNRYGKYILIRYEIPANSSAVFLGELDRYFKIKVLDLVMRFFTKRLTKDALLVYQKPQPVDEVREGRFSSRPPMSEKGSEGKVESDQ